MKNRINPIRPMIQFIKDSSTNHNIIGVEIGVQEGKNAYNMLSNLSIKKLYLIDPYSLYKEYDRQGKLELVKDIKDINIYKQQAIRKLHRFRSKIVFIEKFSDDAVNDINERVDFVYIDGNHAYEYVKKDIETYYPLVRGGGVIGGHDMFNKLVTGVSKAVFEKADELGCDLFVEPPDWWFVKPKA